MMGAGQGRKTVAAGVALGVIVGVLALFLLARPGIGPLESENSQGNTGSAGGSSYADDPYPEPSGTAEMAKPSGPTLTPSPMPDAHGLFPAPPEVVSRTISMAASPWAYLLLSIRTALEARDSGILASYIVDAGGEGAQVVADAGTTQLRPGDADSVFDQLFNNGSLPLIQGYFGYEGAECITLMTSGWVGPASLPPYQPVITLPPNFVTPTPDRPPMDGPGRMSEQVHGPAFAWVVCDYGNQQPAITGWIDGDYHELVFILYQNELSGPDPSPVYTRVLP